MLRIAVVDDDDASANTLERALLRAQSVCGEPIETVRYVNGLNFIEEYKADFDAVFLDIEMPLLNGLETAQKLRERDESVVLVFLTVLSQYVRFGYKVDAAQYLLKPVRDRDIEDVVRRIAVRSKRDEKAYIVVQEHGGFCKVMYRDIIYAESQNHWCTLYCIGGKEYKLLTSMKKLEKKLEGYGFLRSHQSFLVNALHVEGWGKDGVRVRGDKVLPVSRAMRSGFLDGLARLLGSDL